MNNKKGSYYQRRDVKAAFIGFAAQYFGLAEDRISEATALEDLARDSHDLIRFSFAVEDFFRFEFPDGEIGKNGMKTCRANTIKTIGQYVTYIVKLKKGAAPCRARFKSHRRKKSYRFTTR